MSERVATVATSGTTGLRIINNPLIVVVEVLRVGPEVDLEVQMSRNDDNYEELMTSEVSQKWPLTGLN